VRRYYHVQVKLNLEWVGSGHTALGGRGHRKVWSQISRMPAGHELNCSVNIIRPTVGGKGHAIFSFLFFYL
jgi:hypothetical protein